MLEPKYRKTSMLDVARAADVSEATVDRVLNGRGGVSREKEARVLECARKLNLDRALTTVSARWLRIAIVMHRPYSPYHAQVKEGIDYAQKVFEAQRIICVLTFFEGFKPSAIINTMKRAVERADALVILCNEHPDVVAAVRRISQNIPVIALSSDLPGSGRIAYVGPDNRAAGRVAGELMGRFLGEAGGEVLIITGLRDLLGHEERASGFGSVLSRSFPNCRIADILESREQPEVTERFVRDSFKRIPDLRGIYVTSIGVEGVAEGLKAIKRAGSTIVIGHEFNEHTRRFLHEGVMHAVVDENPFNLAMRCVELVLRHYHRDPPLSYYRSLPVAIMLRENLPPTD